MPLQGHAPVQLRVLAVFAECCLSPRTFATIEPCVSSRTFSGAAACVSFFFFLKKLLLFRDVLAVFADCSFFRERFY